MQITGFAGCTEFFSFALYLEHPANLGFIGFSQKSYNSRTTH